MLTKVFNMFEPTEVQLTHGALMRLRIAAILGIFAIPIFAYLKLSAPAGSAQTIAIGAGIFAFAGFAYCAFSRIGNRLWIPESHLDENEVGLKRRVGSLSYQIVMAVIVVATFVAFIAWHKGSDPTISLLTLSYVFASIGGGTACLQTAIAAWMTPPLEGESNVKTFSDKYYLIFTIGILVLLALLSALLGHLLH